MASALVGFAQWVSANTVQYAAAGVGTATLCGGAAAIWWSNAIHAQPVADCGRPTAIRHLEGSLECVLAPDLPFYGAVESSTEAGAVAGGLVAVLLAVVGLAVWMLAPGGHEAP